MSFIKNNLIHFNRFQPRTITQLEYGFAFSFLGNQYDRMRILYLPLSDDIELMGESSRYTPVIRWLRKRQFSFDFDKVRIRDASEYILKVTGLGEWIQHVHPFRKKAYPVVPTYPEFTMRLEIQVPNKRWRLSCWDKLDSSVPREAPIYEVFQECTAMTIGEYTRWQIARQIFSH